LIGVWAFLLCVLGAGAALAAAPAASNSIGAARPATRAPGGLTSTRPVTGTPDALLFLTPEAGGPPNGGAVTVGTTFTLDLVVNTGSHNDATAQQSYMTFTFGTLRVIGANDACPGGVPVTPTVVPDLTTFDAVLQNEICNGPGTCVLRGQTTDPGSFAFASGALSNCPDGCGGIFRVARVHLCAFAAGPATMHWQFTPPAPPVRDTEITTINNKLIQNPALFSDYAIDVLGSGIPTYTPLPSETPTTTRTSTRTRTPGPPPTGTRTGTPAATGTATRTPLGTVTPCPMNFSDVHPSDYFYEAVRYFYCAGIISGYSDSTFRPYNNTTRAQLTKIVVLAEGWPFNIENGPSFIDVPTNDPFYFYVETAYYHQIISGYADHTFRPGNPVTRAQLCKIIVLAQGWTLACPAQHFTDVPPSDPFFCYIETAFAHNIISGYADGTFKPGNSATRGQISKIMYNALLSP
jgi:hypothetical protein